MQTRSQPSLLSYPPWRWGGQASAPPCGEVRGRGCRLKESTLFKDSSERTPDFEQTGIESAGNTRRTDRVSDAIACVRRFMWRCQGQTSATTRWLAVCCPPMGYGGEWECRMFAPAHGGRQIEWFVGAPTPVARSALG